MHELSIAMSIVATLSAEVQAGAKVNAVGIQVGALSGVEPEALQFSWDVVTEETCFSGSRLEIEYIDPIGYCTPCQAEQHLTGGYPLRCPVCQTSLPQVVAGRELDLVSIELAA